MRNLIFAICGIVFAFCASFTVSSALPDTEVWLFDFKVKMGKDGFNRYTIDKGSNISNHEGYDSQPVFGDKGLLWTSEREGGQTEIFRYDFVTKTNSRMTNTQVSEYSPTFVPDGKNISCVVVEPDSTQRLWLYDRQNFSSRMIMPSVTKIGYHSWSDTNTVFVFLLTEPFSLAKCNVRTDCTQTIARNIGRCMVTTYTDKYQRLYYTVKDKDDRATIMAYDLAKDTVVNGFSIPCLPGSEDFATYGNTLFMASEATLFYWDMSSVNNKWVKFADLSSAGLSSISRIAISSDGKHIAVVDNSPDQK